MFDFHIASFPKLQTTRLNGQRTLAAQVQREILLDTGQPRTMGCNDGSRKMMGEP